MTDTGRIGPRMRAALDFVHAGGGAVRGRWNVARAIGPYGSNSYGDRAVMRCVRHGLLSLDGDGFARGGYTVRLTDAGRAALADDGGRQGAVKCTHCGAAGARTVIDPYAQEIWGETVAITVCDACLQEIADDI